MIHLVRATAACKRCEAKFSQIDCTEERAVQIVRDAVTQHLADVHGVREPFAPLAPGGFA